ncbi:MAG TPA: hypothetical protein VF477_11035 [Mycobacterium sp.]
MNTAIQRGLLGFLTLTGAGVGLWAYAAPRNWYDTFPGMGLSWLPQLGPYNEHFVKDVGAMFLGLGLLSVLTLIHIANTTIVKVTAGTWTLFSLLHFIYHMQMLGMYSPRDQVLNVIVLTVILLASALLFIPVRQPAKVTQSA